MAAEVEAGFERLDCVGALPTVPQPGRESGILLRWAWRQARPTVRCVWLRAVSISLGDGGCRNTLWFAGLQQHKTSQALGWLCEAGGVSTVRLGGAKCWEKGGQLCSVTLLWCCSADRYYITVKLCLKME